MTYSNGSFNAGLTVSVFAFGYVAQAFGYPTVFVAVGWFTFGAALALARTQAPWRTSRPDWAGMRCQLR